MSDKAHGKHGTKKRKWIGVMELAEKLGCHSASIPRFIKTKPGFPQPVKLFGKNLWDEEEVDKYVEKLISEQSEVA